MTRSWDNLVSALAGAQMVLGGKKRGQAGYRAGGGYSPLDKPYCTMHHVKQPVCASLSTYTLSSVGMAEERDEQETRQDCVYSHFCRGLQRHVTNHLRVGSGWRVISTNTTAIR